MTVLEAAQSDDEVATLMAVRDALAQKLDEAGPGTVAGVANQLQAVLKRLSELRPAGRVTIDDALAQRRAARSGDADDQASPARKAKRAS
jgi:hypothetical protein